MVTILHSFKPAKYNVLYPRWMAGKPLLYFSSASAALGDALFGYSQGITGAFQVQPSFLHRMYHKDLSMESIQKGETGIDPFVIAITVACLNITALVSSFAAAYVNDLLGRRMTIRIGACIYFISAFVQMFARDLSWLIIGRSIQGIGVGFLSMTVPVYQCEVSPGHARGKFACIEYFFLNCGYLASAWIGYAFFLDIPSEISWRGPYSVQAGLSLLLITMSFLLPETPRWLIKNGFKTESLWTLADLHAAGNITDRVVTQTYHEIVDTLEFEEREGSDASWAELFTRYAKRTLIGFTAQMFAQLNGINAILHFLPENLNRAGFTVPRALLHSGGCAVLYCAGTIPSIFLIDKLGRRCLLLIGSIALAISLAVAGGLQIFVDGIPEGLRRHWGAEGIFSAFGVYLFIYGATWGPTPWLLSAEVFPTRARAKGTAIATASDWFFNFVVALITPPLFHYMPGGYYFILVGACLISFPAVYFLYPETAHKTLEELGMVFGDELPPRRPIEGEIKMLDVCDVGVTRPSMASSQTTLIPEKGSGGTEVK